jgi:hypothetical protein
MPRGPLLARHGLAEVDGRAGPALSDQHCGATASGTIAFTAKRKK